MFSDLRGPPRIVNSYSPETKLFISKQTHFCFRLRVRTFWQANKATKREDLAIVDASTPVTDIDFPPFVHEWG